MQPDVNRQAEATGGPTESAPTVHVVAPRGASSNARARYFKFAGWLLVTTAVAKLITAAGANHLLDMADPILLLRTRELLVFAACAEAAVFWYISRKGGSDCNRAVLLSCLGWCFLVYKALLWFRDPDHPCYCLGWLGKWLLLSERSIAVGTTAIATAFLAGGLLIVMSESRAHQRASSVAAGVSAVC